MGWESRGNGRYYYRKRRKGKRVVSEYIPDSVATLIEQLNALERDERDRLRQVEISQRDQWRAASQKVDEVSEWMGVIVERTLLDNGFHQHKGQWRKKRYG